ncbi:hypothetical protein BH10CHL1_BH10CHL1_04500 [soil metagenome]
MTMTNEFFDPIPQSGRNAYSEPEMQALFTKFLPIEPLPADFAIHLKERVLAEVAIVIKADKTRVISLTAWLQTWAKRSSRWLFTHFWLLVLATGVALWLVTAFVIKIFDLASDD